MTLTVQALQGVQRHEIKNILEHRYFYERVKKVGWNSGSSFHESLVSLSISDDNDDDATSANNIWLTKVS